MQPPSSKAANDKMNATGTKLKHVDIIYNIMAQCHNQMATATQIALKSNLDYVEINRRLSELVTAKRIEVFSEKGGRTATGNACRVYRAIVAGNVSETPTNKQTELFN